MPCYPELAVLSEKATLLPNEYPPNWTLRPINHMATAAITKATGGDIQRFMTARVQWRLCGWP